MGTSRPYRSAVNDPAKEPLARDSGRKTPAAAWGVCGFLCVAVFLAFGQTVRYEFVNYDDDAYVYENPHVKAGLSAEGVAWAFTRSHAGNWHPVTWLSHMLDCQLYGLWAGGHHLTNVLLHAVSAVLLFLVLLRMTGAFWPSVLVAAVFAVHPLRAESVAWIAERKDVLCGVFFMLSLTVYERYVRGPFSWKLYLALVACFALGIMSKPMLVTLPFVLLLLDVWPLRRIDLGGIVRNATDAPRTSLRPLGLAVAEKLPLLAISAASCIVTVKSQWAGLDERLHAISFGDRAANAVIAYAAYVAKMFCPVDLAVLYPHPEAHWQSWQLAIAGTGLLVVSVVVWCYRSRAYLVVGWLWYLGMLLPVIGLLQVGKQAMADRYTYLPQIGLYVFLAWAIHDVARRWPQGERVYAVGSVLLALGLLGGVMYQTGYWRDSETLWTHAIACTAPNAMAHYDLGVFLDSRGRTNEAVDQFLQALRIDPQDFHACNNLGAAMLQNRRIDAAIGYFQRGLTIRPNDGSLHTNLGAALLAQGQVDQALEEFGKAVDCNPGDAKSQYHLGVALLRKGRALAAVDHYREALKIDPEYVNAETGLGVALHQLGRDSEALDHLRKSLRRQPDAVAVLKLTAGILATDVQASVCNGAEALELSQRAARITRGRDAGVLDVLAAAYAETGQFAAAIQVAEQSLALAAAANDRALAEAVRAKISLYQSGTAYRAR